MEAVHNGWAVLMMAVVLVTVKDVVAVPMFGGEIWRSTLIWLVIHLP